MICEKGEKKDAKRVTQKEMKNNRLPLLIDTGLQ